MTLSIKDIQSKLDAMAATISDKGWKNAEADLVVRAGGVFNGWARGNHPRLTHWDDHMRHYTTGGTIPEILSKMKTQIDKLEDVSKSEKKEWMKSLAVVIDKGKEIGVDIEYLNPLTETMKALSENIITDQTNA